MEFWNDDGNGKKRYYGMIEEIWELEYSGEYKMAMFHVRWAKCVEIGDRYFATMCIPEAQPAGKITTQNEPWVFTKDVAHCFFVTD
jgi:hypothetical protein